MTVELQATSRYRTIVGTAHVHLHQTDSVIADGELKGESPVGRRGMGPDVGIHLGEQRDDLVRHRHWEHGIRIDGDAGGTLEAMPSQFGLPGLDQAADCLPPPARSRTGGGIRSGLPPEYIDDLVRAGDRFTGLVPDGCQEQALVGVAVRARYRQAGAF